MFLLDPIDPNRWQFWVDEDSVCVFRVRQGDFVYAVYMCMYSKRLSVLLAIRFTLSLSLFSPLSEQRYHNTNGLSILPQTQRVNVPARQRRTTSLEEV